VWVRQEIVAQIEFLEGMDAARLVTLVCYSEREFPRGAMADPKRFIDNLKNLRMVMDVALEHLHENRTHFVKDATGNQLRQVEKSISQSRVFAGRIKTEFNTVEYLIGKRTL
jgi:hypothetical protein